MSRNMVDTHAVHPAVSTYHGLDPHEVAGGVAIVVLVPRGIAFLKLSV